MTSSLKMTRDMAKIFLNVQNNNGNNFSLIILAWKWLLKGVNYSFLVIFVRNGQKDVILGQIWRHTSKMTRDMTKFFFKMFSTTRGATFLILV